MEFKKNFGVRKGREPGFGSLYISDGLLKVRINVNNSHIVEMGTIDGGIGCVIKQGDKTRKTPYAAACFKYEEDWIPIELQGQSYKLAIPAEKISDTEYAFMFDKAKMKNKK